MIIKKPEEPTVLRRIGSHNTHNTLNISLPKSISELLKLDKGDYLRIHVDGTKIVMEKLATDQQ